MKILAFQPWDGGSHRAVRSSIQRHSTGSWDWVALRSVGPRWRLRLGAAEVLAKAGEQGVLDEERDVVFTTGMLDAAQLRGLLPAHLSSKPLVLYMHENQAAYPVSERVAPQDRERDAHLIATNIASMLAADLVLWNSAFNRDSFLEEAGSFLKHAPDRIPRSWAALIDERSEIAWPPVEPIPEAVLRNPRSVDYPDAPRIAWPHRWEHDKGPEELLHLADQLGERLNLRFLLMGERSSRIPPALEVFRERHAARIVHDGWVEDRAEYLGLLASADWVLSTARHEFFGIAVVEALGCGCLPWLPERLSYPELLPEFARGLSPMNVPKEPELIREAIRAHLEPAAAPAAVGRIEALIRRVATIEPSMSTQGNDRA